MRKKGNWIRRMVLICLAALVVSGGLIWAAFTLTSGGGTVKVYALWDVGTDTYWGDTSQTEGIVRTDRMQPVYLSETQKVTEIYVQEGQTVQAGDPLVALDTTLSDLAVERQRIAVEKLEQRLSESQRELKRLRGLKPYQPVTPTPMPEPTPLEPVELPYRLGGQGTVSDPYRYLWNDECWYTPELLEELLPPIPSEEPTPSQMPPESPESSAEPTADLAEKETAAETEAYAVFEVREYNNPAGTLLERWGMRFIRSAQGQISFCVYQPELVDEPVETPEEDESLPDAGGEEQYTATELAQLCREKEKEIADLSIQIKVEQVRYEKLQLEKETGVVTAQVDGVVQGLMEPQQAQSSGEPLLTVSGGGGYLVTGTVSELKLDQIAIGQEVSVQSWMSGMETVGELREISLDPVNSYTGYGGNQNVSYYPVTVFVSSDAALQPGEYVGLSWSSGGNGGGVFLQIPFVRTENGQSYVYRAAQDGRLEKQIVSVGRRLDGYYVEILSGLTMEDFVAFPYGKEVRAGAQTEQAGLDTLYGY